MTIIGSESHCPMERLNASSPRKLVGLAAEFRDEAEESVAHEERARHGARGPRLARIHHSTMKSSTPSSAELVELRRVARERLADRAAETTSPTAGRWAAPAARR
jgi:hypothetical protein